MSLINFNGIPIVGQKVKVTKTQKGFDVQPIVSNHEQGVPIKEITIMGIIVIFMLLVIMYG